MNTKYYVLTYEERACNEPDPDTLFDGFRQAYHSLLEKYFINMHWDIYYSEFNPDEDGDFKWDLCICLAELNGSRITNHYPVRFFKLKKNYMQVDSNPVRLIDIMKILNRDNKVSIRYETECQYTKLQYDSLDSIPESFYYKEVRLVSEQQLEYPEDSNKRIYVITISNEEVK